MNTIAPQLPAITKTAPATAPAHVLLRSNLPAKYQFLTDFSGSPAGNNIGIRLLGECVRANLGLPVGQVQAAWYLLAGFILIDCGTIPAADVIAASVSLLERVHLTNYFTIMVLDDREGYYRPYHTGGMAGDTEIVTPESLAESARKYRVDCETRSAALDQAFRPAEPGQ